MTAKKKREGKRPRKKKEGMRTGQIRVLLALSTLSPQGGLTRAKLSELVGATNGWVYCFTGSTDEKQREKTEKEMGYPSLLTLSYIRTLLVQAEEGLPKERIYRITAAGRKALEAAMQDERTAKMVRKGMAE